jgi:hypothetical protein
LKADTVGIGIAAALHAVCIELEQARRTPVVGIQNALDARAWIDKVGIRVVQAISAIPDDVLRGWLLDPCVIGGTEVYKTLREGASIRAAGRQVAE